MNIRDLKYVLAVAETHHFGRAAERCYVSQPTLSGQIKKLEEELGVVIFERTKRSVEVTPIGAEIISLARNRRTRSNRSHAHIGTRLPGPYVWERSQPSAPT